MAVPVTVTALPVPALALANAPVPLVRLTLSPAITPLNAPPARLAAVLPSYTWPVAVCPVTLSALGVMSAVKPVGLLTV